MISVLYVDDESPLLDLCKLFLEKTGDFNVDTYISAQEALETPPKTSFDCIVSDYQMPYMNGIQFLQALRSRGDATPFIIFTGKGREEVAIQALNSGADFYLQKGGEPDVQFVELAHMITQAVRRKKGEEALRKSEERYRNVVENQTEFVTRFFPDGTHRVANAAYCRYFGKSCKEMINSRFIPNIPEEDKGRVRQHFASLTPENAVATIEHRIVMPDGQVRWQQWSDRAIFDANGTLHEYQSVGRDITDRKLAEEELLRKNEELRAAYEELTTAEEELRQNYDELVTMEKNLRESELRYRNVVEDQTEFISRFLPDGTHVFVNEAYCRYFNKKREEILGTKFIPDIPEEDRSLVKQHFASLTPENSVATIEHRIVMPDGQVRWQRWSDRVIFDAGNQVIEYQSVGRDMTDRKEAEELLQRSEIRYRSLFEGVPVGLYRSTPAGQILDVNPALMHTLGYPDRESMLAISVPVLYADPDARKEWQARLEHEGIVRDFEAQFLKCNGATIRVRETSKAVRDDSGRIVYYEGILMDVTERKQAEEELCRKNDELCAAYEQLTANEEKLRTNYEELIKSQQEIREREQFISEVVRGVREGIIVTDCKLSVTLWNPFVEELTGVPAADVLGKNAIEVFPFLKGTEVARLFEEALSGSFGESGDFPFFIKSTGSKGWVKGLFSPHYDATGKIIGMIGVVRDITRRKEAENALRGSEERYRTFFTTSRDCVFITSREGTWIDFNDVALDLFGYESREELQQTNVRLLYADSQDRKRHLAIISEKGYSKEYPVNLKKKDGTIINTLITTVPRKDRDDTIIGFQGTIRDITDRKQAQEALSQANKKLNLLSSITRHDILNQLVVLKGYLELSERFAQDPAKLGGFIKKEIKAAQTIEEQICFTRDYQDMGINAPAWQNVNAGVSRAVAALPMRNIRVKADRTDFELFADPLLERAFYNLIDNALRHGGDTITTVRISSNESDHGMIIVCEDDGVGIFGEAKKHLFERGFGTHTGLGLYLVREILSITGITISENGEPGKGARFEIFVPEGTYRFMKMQQ